VAKQPAHGGLGVAHFVLVARGATLITGSGRVRSACVERYLSCEFTHLDVPA